MKILLLPSLHNKVIKIYNQSFCPFTWQHYVPLFHRRLLNGNLPFLTRAVDSAKNQTGPTGWCAKLFSARFATLRTHAVRTVLPVEIRLYFISHSLKKTLTALCHRPGIDNLLNVVGQTLAYKCVHGVRLKAGHFKVELKKIGIDRYQI